MSYTPGPWKDRPSMWGQKLRFVRLGENVNYTTGDVLADDARLISAAPDLFEALQEIVDATDTGWEHLDATFTRARAALKKAKGER